MTKQVKLCCRLVVASVLFAFLGLLGSGCATTQSQVVSLPNQQTLELNSDDVVKVMRRAGFSDEQILEFGTEVRNGLARSGAAQVEVGKSVEAIFAVDGHYIHGTSLARGSFVYDLSTGAFR